MATPETVSAPITDTENLQLDLVAIATETLAAYQNREKQIALARINFEAFVRYVWPRFKVAPHLQLIMRELMMLTTQFEAKQRGEEIENPIKNSLMVELPPRHGKSTLVARLFPAWFLGRNPESRVILASYGSSLAEKHSRFVREIIRTTRYQQVFPNVRLSDDSAARDSWDLASPHEGGMDAMGKGGAIAGKGGHLIVTDDLVKSRAEAESETQRELDWDWLQDDLLTRREPGGFHVAIGTRWHEDDVHGRIKRNELDLWKVITLPAIAEKDDLLGRKPGEALWPARYTTQDLVTTKRRMGDYSFAALYQQNPQPKEGGIIKVKLIEKIMINTLPAYNLEKARTVRFWDLAMSSEDSADYTVGVKMCEWGDKILILDVVRKQIEWPEVPALIMATALRDGKRVHIGVEKVAYMSRAVKDIAKARHMREFIVNGFPPEHDKFTRALPFAARVGEELVMCAIEKWTDSYLSELASFPFGANDDQVDATAGAYMMLSRKPITVTKKAIGV